MIPLALTSTTGWIRRLGGRNWQRLHRLVYLTGIAGVTHYWWKVKADTLHPAVYALIVGLLLGVPPDPVVEAIALAAAARSGTRLNADSRSDLERLLPTSPKKIRHRMADMRRWEVVRRIWDRDPSVWSGSDEDQWLGWLMLPMQDAQAAGGGDAIRRRDQKRKGSSDVVLLGMGGSSLAPEVIRSVIGRERRLSQSARAGFDRSGADPRDRTWHRLEALVCFSWRRSPAARSRSTS